MSDEPYAVCPGGGCDMSEGQSVFACEVCGKDCCDECALADRGYEVICEECNYNAPPMAKALRDGLQRLKAACDSESKADAAYYALCRDRPDGMTPKQCHDYSRREDCALQGEGELRAQVFEAAHELAALVRARNPRKRGALMSPEDAAAPPPYEPEIAPCPFGCALPARTETIACESPRYFVLCPACRGSGPICYDAATAVARWNTSAQAETALVLVVCQIKDGIRAVIAGEKEWRAADRQKFLDALVASVSPVLRDRIAAKVVAEEAASG